MVGDVLRRRILVLLTLALLLVAGLGVAAPGCGDSGTGGPGSLDGSATTLNGTATGGGTESVSTATTQMPGDSLDDAKMSLALVFGVAEADIQVTSKTPGSPNADFVLEWQGGQAEVDSTTGRVYLVSGELSAGGSYVPFLSEARLVTEARRIMNGLGWTDTMLGSVGFQQERPGTLTEGTGLYTVAWAQYDSEGIPMDGAAELRVDGRTGGLVYLSVSPGVGGPDLAGALTEADALAIAQTEIYLKTKEPKISLAGDGSLILLNRSVTEQLTIIDDREMTGGKPLDVWVITLTGTSSGVMVGGTTYIDAATGDVLKYVPYEEE
jgi:hypothetical protein